MNRTPFGICLPRYVLAMSVIASGASFATSGCKEASFGGTKKSDTTSAEPAKRPTLEDEGIDGYLADPALVRVDAKGNTHTAIGRPGAVVATTGGRAGEVNIGAWKQGTAAAAKKLACARSRDDGSFTLAFELSDGEGDAVITVGIDCSKDESVLPAFSGDRVRLVAAQSDGSVQRYKGAPSCMCPEGQRVEPLTLRCTSKPAVNSGECVEEDPLVCGCDGVTYESACLAEESGVRRQVEGQCGG